MTRKVTVKKSTLYSKTTHDSVGKGLFAKTNFAPHEVITQFKGEIKNAEDFANTILNNPDEENYTLELADGNYLCCYTHAKALYCYASYANNCINVYRENDPHSVVRPNAWIREMVREVNRVEDPNTIGTPNALADEVIPYHIAVYLVASTHISQGDEIIVKYN